MEKRRSSRKLLRRNVGLDSPRGGSISARMHDVSLGGMFVETDPEQLPSSASVTVSFALPQNGMQTVFVLEAAVVRRAPNGLGLMFLRMEPDVIRTLSETLAAHQEREPVS